MRRLVVATLMFAMCFALSSTLLASDHADPIFNKRPDAGLTGLFVFTAPAEATEPPPSDEAAAEAADETAEEPAIDDADGAGDASSGVSSEASAVGTPPVTRDQDLILILGIHPSLIAPGPYDLEGLRFAIHIDHHSDVTFADPADLARYGGTVVHPRGISPDVTLGFALDDEAQLVDTQVEGLDASQVEAVSGVYDDPFIFPRFFGKNVIAIAVRLPVSTLPAGRQDFLFWGTTTKDGEQVDHVGRSNRTQLPRFDFLNTVPPHEHVEVIHEVAHKRQRVRNFLRRYPPPALYQAFDLLQSIRHYDYVPDVMIFSLGREPGYPNGRRLQDDIVAISCAVGDCLLQETSFQESEAWPRIKTNDKPFASDFPYLAAPWPEEKPESTPGCFWPTLLILVVLGFFTWLVCKLLCKLCRRKSKTAADGESS